jgi:hypothetical protein
MNSRVNVLRADKFRHRVEENHCRGEIYRALVG